MVDAALRAAGHRSARFTSPHLIDLAERFVIDGHPVAARQDNLLVISFHPEIAGENRVHELFMRDVGVPA